MDTDEKIFQGRIHDLERHDLDKEIEWNSLFENFVPQKLTKISILEKENIIYYYSENKLGLKFLKIKGISRILSEEKKLKAERYLMEDVLSGLYAQNISNIYFIRGHENNIQIYFGVFARGNTEEEIIEDLSRNMDNLVTSLEGTYPNIDVSTVAIKSELVDLINFVKGAEHFGIMIGIPTPKIGTEEVGVEQIERLIRALYGEQWGYIVVSDPLKNEYIFDTFDVITNEIREKYGMIKKSESSGTSYGQVSKEMINRSAQYYIELLESELERYKIGKAEGMWNVAAYFFSPDKSTFDKMNTVLRSVFTGESSLPDTIRTINCHERIKDYIKQFKLVDLKNGSEDSILKSVYPYKFLTVLSSKDLATLVHLSNEEMPGYDVRASARYGVCIPEDLKNGNIQIGDVIDRGGDTGNKLCIEEHLLAKHGLIIGITGSGKTNTCFHLLTQIWEELRIPFLVIEPTKGEYRNLIDAIPKLRVFTLGNETIAPFRMNPFEIPEGVHVQTHLDKLKAIFNASFTLYPPMPYVLEHCLINVYEKSGWNLALNKRGRTPTLDNLYNEIDVVVRGLGYHTEVSMNVRAALRTRIRSLLLGGKGKMLNCEKSMPIEEILKYPTVLELKGVGDDEEKAFLMGILFGKLYEYREAHGNFDILQHITLIEEAHRLLSNVPPGTEETNQAKAKAVETLCNILTEVRVYGEGILVVDQVPTKLAPDAIKNTNVKIIHRTIAGDDRAIISESIGLSEIQKQFLINLRVGQAVAFLEKLDEPFMLQIPDVKDKIAGALVQKYDKDVKAYMEGYYEEQPEILAERKTGPFIGCDYCEHKCEYRFMMEPLINDKKLQEGIMQAITEENGEVMMERFRSLLFPAVRALGYAEESPEDAPAKALCALIQFLNTIPPTGPKYRDNILFVAKDFKQRTMKEIA